MSPRLFTDASVESPPTQRWRSRSRRRVVGVALGVALGLPLCGVARAQQPPKPPPPPDAAELAKRVKDLEASQQALADRLAAEQKDNADARAKAEQQAADDAAKAKADAEAKVKADEEAAAKADAEAKAKAKKESEAKAKADEEKSKTFKVSGGPGKGVTLESDKFSLNIRSRIQLRYQLDVTAPDDEGERDRSQIVNIGTARFWLSGHALTRDLTYMIQLAVAGRDFRENAVSPIFDAFVDYKAHRDFNVRAGQYFVPFDRLRTVREFALQMADRPRPVAELTLDRDAGVTFYSENFLGDESPLAYRLSAFGGGGTNLTLGKKPGALLVGRLELRPLGKIDDDSEGDQDRRDKPGLALGAAVASNFNTNRLRSTTGATFTGGVTDYFHAAADLVFKWKGFALQAEYLVKNASVDAIDSTDDEGAAVREFTRSGRGWVTQASYTFDPPFEIVGRLSRLYADEGTDPKFVSEIEARGQEVGLGLNYYVNGHRMKLQADWIALAPPDFDLGDAQHVAHVQLDATF